MTLLFMIRGVCERLECRMVSPDLLIWAVEADSMFRMSRNTSHTDLNNLMIKNVTAVSNSERRESMPSYHPSIARLEF